MERTKSNLENCLYPYNCTTRNSSILRFTGNIDYTNSNTAPTWTNKPNGLMPIESQQLQTNSSQQYINISDEFSPARVTYHPSTSAAGDTSTVEFPRFPAMNDVAPGLMGCIKREKSATFYVALINGFLKFILNIRAVSTARNTVCYRPGKGDIKGCSFQLRFFNAP